MKFLQTILCLILVSVLFTQCTTNKDKEQDIPIIKFNSSSIEVVEDILFDTLLQKPEYIILETGENCLIDNIAGLTVSSKEILIISRGRVLVFDRAGRFISQLGSEGRGPGEYLNPLNVAFDETTNIYTVYGYMNLVQFYSGKNVLRKIKLNPDLKRMYQLNSELFVSELKIEPQFGDSAVFSLEFFDSGFESLYKHKTAESSDPVDGQLFIVDLMGYINYSDRGLLFKETYGDTIYTLNDRMEVKPFLILDSGDEKYPKELSYNMEMYMKTNMNYIQLGKFATSKNTFFSSYRFNGESHFAITDMAANKTITPYNTTCKKYGFVLSPFPGYNFRPFFTDGYLANVILPTDVVKHFDKNTNLIPEEIKEKILALDESDNPLLVLGAWK